jgi:hypothetical protein
MSGTEDVATKAIAKAAPQWQRPMIEATPDSLLREIVRDQRTGVPPPSMDGTTGKVSAVRNHGGTGIIQDRSGWRNALPLANPPGIAIIDKMASAGPIEDLQNMALEIVKGVKAGRLQLSDEQRRKVNASLPLGYQI